MSVLYIFNEVHKHVSLYKIVDRVYKLVFKTFIPTSPTFSTFLPLTRKLFCMMICMIYCFSKFISEYNVNEYFLYFFAKDQTIFTHTYIFYLHLYSGHFYFKKNNVYCN